MTRWASEPVIDLSNSPCNAPSPVPIYVDDWWGCEFIFTPNIEARLNILWGELTPDGDDIVDSNSNTLQQYSSFAVAGGLAHVIPHLGPYMRIFVDTQGSAPGLFDLSMRHTNRKDNGADFQESPLTVVSAVMPVGLTRVPITPYVGPAYVSVFSTATGTSSIQVIGHDATGLAAFTLVDVLFWGSLPNYSTPREMWLPALNNELWFTNNSGAAVQMNATLQAVSNH